MTGEEIYRLLAPTVESLGYELVDVELRLGGKNGLLRLYIDQPDGIGLSDCETVSRQVSTVLDVEDPIPGHYVLEVSSPGLDRRLTKPEHYRRFLGADVRIKLRFPVEGRRNFRGALRAANEVTVEVEVDGKLHELPLTNIESARLVPAA